MLHAEVKKWKVKKDWFEALNEIHDRKAQLENAIAWAQVEDLEKKAEVAVNQLNDHDAKIGRVSCTIWLGLYEIDNVVFDNAV